MGFLGRFDLSTDFTQFFVGAFVILMLFAVLLTWVSPARVRQKKGGGKVDDRFVNTDGELID